MEDTSVSSSEEGSTISRPSESEDHERADSTDGQIADDAEGLSLQRQASPGKRKRTSYLQRDGKKKLKLSEHENLPGQIVHAYVDALNNMIEEAVTGADTIQKYGDSGNSQIGMSRWSGKEKDAVLSRLCRGRIVCDPSVSSPTPKKSQAETRQFLQVLKEYSNHKAKEGHKREIPRYSDIPAAYEIGDECCNALDHAANAIILLTQRQDDAQERQRHGTDWLLDRNKAIEIERWLLDDQDVRDHGKKEPFHGDNTTSNLSLNDLASVVKLLRLPVMLKLSELFFMNGAPTSDPAKDGCNWRDLADQNHTTPSIYKTAFSDFYSVVVSLTKRIVSAAIFQANSRVRATDTRLQHGREYFVTPRDVEAALDILGLAKDCQSFWARMPIKCGLQVYRTAGHDKITVNEMALGSTLSPDEIAQEFQGEMDLGDTSSDSDDAASDMSSVGCNDSYQDLLSIPDTTPQDAYAVAEQDYAEAVDRNNSRVEETRLWQMLEQPPPASIDLQIRKLAPRPRLQRKSSPDMVDWRDRIDYEAEWEHLAWDMPFQQQVTTSQRFARSGRTRRRHSDDARVASSADGSDTSAMRESPMETVEAMSEDLSEMPSDEPSPPYPSLPPPKSPLHLPKTNQRHERPSRVSRSRSRSRRMRSPSDETSESGGDAMEEPRASRERPRRSSVSASRYIIPTVEEGGIPADDDDSDEYMPDG